MRGEGEKAPEDRIVTPEFVYTRYKKRGCVEEEIDVYKNILEADKTYMRDEEALEGWTFCNFVALQWYYRIQNRLDGSGLGGRYSCSSTISFLNEVIRAKVNDEWMDFPLTNKEQKLFNALGLSSEQEFVFPNENGK